MFRMKALPFAILVVAAMTAPVVGQRPKTVDQAVARFEKVRDQAERNRHQAARDLGRFADEKATAILVTELQRAETTGYQNTVVSALGRQEREGAVAVLRAVMVSTPNSRLAESAANALRAQGADGVDALVEELPQSAGNKRLRDAICYSLGRLTSGDAARDALLGEIERTTRKDRQAALRGLAARQGDARVDAMRVKLVADKDTYLASLALEQLGWGKHKDSAKLAITLARRIPAVDYTHQHTAVLVALLHQPGPEHYPALLFAGARANKPFQPLLVERWRECLADGALAKWLRDQGAKAKEDGMQVIAARALALTPKEHQDLAYAALESLLQKRSLAVVQAAATALVTLDPNDRSAAPLQALLKKGHRDKAPIAVTALHALQAEDAAWQAQLLQLCRHKRAGIRAAALCALMTTAANEDEVLAAAQENLSHRAWQVRSVAIDLLVKRRLAGAPPLLFARLPKEEARLLFDLKEALRGLTGLQFQTLREWQNWWDKQGATFEPIKPTSEQRGRRDDSKTVSYWNIPVTSNRVTFVVDTSGSMLKPFGSGNATRLVEAKRQLGLVFDGLPPKAKVNVITFDGDVTELFGKLQALSKKKRKEADVFVDGLTSRGPTNVHGALAKAFEDPDVDTIFLLTDGQPSAGQIVDRDRLADEVARWNAGRSIRIHTVAIGQKSDLLARLAKDSGGQHRVSR